MATKKGKFSEKAQRITEPKPHSITDFLENPAGTETRKAVNTKIRKPVKTGRRKPVNTDYRKTDRAEATKREELKMPLELAEWLREYAFMERTTKTAVIVEALNRFRKTVNEVN